MLSYLITDPKFYKDDIFSELLCASFTKYSPSFACYRDKRDANNLNLKIAFLQACKSYGIKSFINGYSDDVTDFNGIHLTSKEYDLIPDVKNTGLICIASCHTRDDIILCIKSGADYVTLSPIFFSPQKPSPLGIKVFSDMASGYEDKIFALGGIISDEQVGIIKTLGVAGFASIRYFAQ